MVLFAKSSDFSASLLKKSLTSPGCETEARSGGFPPETAVERTVGVLSPVAWYFTVTFGYLDLKPFRTAWNDFCSGPVQTPVMVTLPLTLVPPVLLVFLELSFEPPPHPAASRSSGSASATRATRYLLIRLLSWRPCRRRSRDRSRGRRNGAPVCRRRPRPSLPGRPASERRSVRPSSSGRERPSRAPGGPARRPRPA